MNQTRLEAPRPGSAEYWQQVAADRGLAIKVLREEKEIAEAGRAGWAYIAMAMTCVAVILGVLLAVVK